ncbi:hypothetical protein [Actinomadura madurae]|uniref:hypothetical protein n=1 Tax=Actinomadura madurae TaxID=1993 RepID=UPI0020D210A6|nr:hypothetical protein [Actinomadura madurae]MCQ0018584.1 hypothetical protein [Actinomadura madurae]
MPPTFHANGIGLPPLCRSYIAIVRRTTANVCAQSNSGLLAANTKSPLTLRATGVTPGSSVRTRASAGPISTTVGMKAGRKPSAVTDGSCL